MFGTMDPDIDDMDDGDDELAAEGINVRGAGNRPMGSWSGRARLG